MATSREAIGVESGVFPDEVHTARAPSDPTAVDKSLGHDSARVDQAYFYIFSTNICKS